jgi:hypothetical protein
LLTPVSIADEAFAALVLSNACFTALREIRVSGQKLSASVGRMDGRALCETHRGMQTK